MRAAAVVPTRQSVNHQGEGSPKRAAQLGMIWKGPSSQSAPTAWRRPVSTIPMASSAYGSTPSTRAMWCT